jgi:hypothetical protein
VSDAPTPLDRAQDFAVRFRGNANSLAMTYGGPVYLVGSLLTSPMPGDVDIRITLEREDMDRWFGKSWDEHGFEWTKAKWRLEREQLKQSRRLARRWRGYPTTRFDVQFQCCLFSDADGLPIMREGKPFLRLDATPLDYFRAGRGDP